MKISSILLNYPTLEGDFLHILLGKTNSKLEFLYVHCSVLTKKLINKKVRKVSILSKQYTFKFKID